MRCGKGHDHPSVASVRACYGVGTEQPQGGSYRNGGASPITSRPTEKQARFLRTLRLERGISADGIGRLTRQAASDEIDRLLKTPKTQTAREPYPNVPAGHYAVDSLTGHNDLDFFRVDRPEDGPHKGRTFVKRIIGGHPDAPVRGRTAIDALKAILAADPEKASIRYGQELGRCYRCNRHLTDETSRALGIGPDCRSGH